MHGTQQGIVDGLRAGVGGSQPLLHHDQVARHLGIEDFQQQIVDLRRHHVHCGCRCRFFCNCLTGRLDHGRFSGRRNFTCRCAALRRARHGFVAAGNARGVFFQRGKIHVQAAFALQRGLQHRQGVEGVINHRQHGRRRRAGSFKNPVEQALDLPAELTQGARAHQAPAALEGMEHAADRPQAFHVVRVLAPGREQRVEVVDLLGKLLQEDFADLVIDFIASGFKAALIGGLSGFGRLLRSAFHSVRIGISHRGGDTGSAGRARIAVRRARHHARAVDEGRHGGRGFRQPHRVMGHVVHIPCKRRLLRRQRPVAQCFQAVAGDIKDVLAATAVLAERLQVVLQAGQGVGQGVELAAVGHPAAPQQFGFGKAAHAGEEVRRLLQLEHAHRAAHLAQQARHFDQFIVVPAGFNERDKGLARIGEVGDRLTSDDFHRLARLAGQRILLLAAVIHTQARHLLVQ